jgi:hypothetical protein
MSTGKVKKIRAIRVNTILEQLFGLLNTSGYNNTALGYLVTITQQ